MPGLTVESMLAELNTNLASGKRSLEEMHESGDHSFQVRGGGSVEIPEVQLDLIWNVCDDSERLRLRLPIYVSTDTSSDSGSWKVEGRVEVAVITKLLGKTLHIEDRLRLYHPDYKQLKTMIPDAIMVVFTP